MSRMVAGMDDRNPFQLDKAWDEQPNFKLNVCSSHPGGFVPSALALSLLGYKAKFSQVALLQQLDSQVDWRTVLKHTSKTRRDSISTTSKTAVNVTSGQGQVLDKKVPSLLVKSPDGEYIPIDGSIYTPLTAPSFEPPSPERRVKRKLHQVWPLMSLITVGSDFEIAESTTDHRRLHSPRIRALDMSQNQLPRRRRLRVLDVHSPNPEEYLP
ncbi:hypothetical protein H0H87_001633 [Tephrocybe sp. NHM501043]|nr:hypothetical protein H0H87_001633 [Tephrocybe sp. NHM501043]